ncbi:putative Polysaccharide biosynthesis protein [Vibrio coralliirubri]|uniref:flippase n=1 Tax=Vibrio coralliirubri TaxID=1516159 RepID=UPI0006336ABE|nr:flippase [Vibrio coralliirubri]CDT88208.1 putative Polysaccharide biosynthesis protein [Vibrio coralliirubri]
MIRIIKKHSDKVLNSAWMLVEKFFLLVVEFFVVALIAKNIGVQDYGKLSFILSVVTFLTPFTVFGLSGVLVRYCIDSKKNTISSVMSNAIILRLLASFIILMFLFLISKYIGIDFEIRYYLFLLASCEVVKSFNSVSSWFESKLQSKVTSKVRIFSVIISTTLRLFGLYDGCGWEYFIIIQCIEVLVNSILLVVTFKYLTPYKLRASLLDFELLKELARKGFPLLISSIGAIIYLKSDILMMKYILDDRAVGVYSAAVRITELAYVLPIIFMVAVFPSMMKKKMNGEAEEFGKVLLCVLFYSGTLIAIILFQLSDFIINIIYGSDYGGSIIVLSIHCFTLPFVFSRAYISKWIIVEELYFLSLITQTSGAVVNIIGNYILIPIYGPSGAAVSTLISFLFASFIPLLFFKRSRGVAINMINSPIFPIIRYLK